MKNFSVSDIFMTFLGNSLKLPKVFKVYSITFSEHFLLIFDSMILKIKICFNKHF